MSERNFAVRMLNVVLLASLLLAMVPVKTRAGAPSAETPTTLVAHAASTPEPQSPQAGTTIYLPLVLRMYGAKELPVTLDQYADSWLLLPGDVTTYTLVVQNPGDFSVQSGELTAEAPEIVEPVAGGASHGGAYNAQTRQVRWNLPAMAGGDTLTVTFLAQVTAGAPVTATSTARLTATLSSGSVYTDSDPAYVSVGVAVTQTLTPAGGTLIMPDSKASLIVPSDAVTQPTQVRLASFPVPFETRDLPTRWQVFFDVTAVGTTGAVLHDADGHTRFLKPLTATVNVESTWEQPFLAHLVDSAEGYPVVSTEFDRMASVITATLQTFSAYGAGGSDPYADSGTYHMMTNQPSTGIFNGAALYSYQLDVPTGRRGLTPKISLNYSSSSMNSILGVIQSSNVGMGWNLGGQVQIVRPVKTYIQCSDRDCLPYWWSSNRFVLTINGTSYNLEDYTNDPNGGCRYDVTDGPGLRVMRYTIPAYEGNQYCGYPAGVTKENVPNDTKEYWEVTTGDGTVYRLGYTQNSEQLMRMDKYGPDRTCSDLKTCAWDYWYKNEGYAGELARRVAHRWSVDLVRDVYDNVMEYGYYEEPAAFYVDSGIPHVPFDRAQHLDWIRYGGNAAQGLAGMYMVDFVLESRTNANDNGGGAWFDAGPEHNDDFKKEDWSMWEEWRLDRIKVCANSSDTTCNSGTLLADYDLDYDFVIESSDKHIETTRLQRITRYGQDAVSALPATTFGYESLSQEHPTEDYALPYPRLHAVDNGYGGVATFAYEKVTMGFFFNYSPAIHYYNEYDSYRVKSQTTNDGLGNTSTVTYTYDAPCFNFWRDQNSCSYPGSEADFSLAGHDNVTQEVWGYNGELLTKTRHWFHYKQSENWRMGREYKTEAYSAAGATPLQRTETLWTHEAVNSATFTYASIVTATDHTVLPPLTTRKEYQYNPLQQGGQQLGLLTHVREYDSQNVLQRINFTNYIVNKDKWIMRPWLESVMNASWVRQTTTFHLYDGNMDPNMQTLDKGALTLDRALLMDGTGCPVTDRTLDTSYEYNVYGNVVTTTTYADYGKVACEPLGGGVNDWESVTAPGDGKTPYMSVVSYDDTYQLFPVKTRAGVGTLEEQYNQTEYYGVSGVADCAADAAGYFFGAVCRQWGPNGPDTAVHYHYDAFGRKIETWLPGENVTGNPSERIQYRDVTNPDWRPMPVTIWNRHIDASSFYSENVTLWKRVFYDGLGRVVQTHTPSEDWTYAADGYDIVQNTLYDGLGRAVSQSVPYQVPSYYYDANDPQNPYHTPDLNQPQTRTEYDMLGRVTKVSNPDETAATMAYAGRETTAVDANGHQMRQMVDDLGRMVQVEEFTGQAGSATVYATTHYGYDMLDNLVVVTDTKGNTTTMAYDGLGRKLAMDDPDMGEWRYEHNSTGTLQRQIDARGCEIVFMYDSLSRPIEKRYEGAAGCAQPSVTYTYDVGLYGRGQRTGMTYSGGATTYVYDVRGRLLNTTQTFSGTTFTTSYTYDDLDRQVSVTYPGGEVVTTGYDNAGYPSELASNQSAESYVSSMLYNELGLPTEMVMGNGVVTQWGYKGMRGMWDRTGTVHPYYQYGSLWRTRVSNSAGKPLFDQILNYDNAGNVTMVREAPLSVQNWPLAGTETFSDTFDVQKAGWVTTGQHAWTTADDGATVLRTTGVASKTQALLTRSGYGLSAGEGVQLRFKVSNIKGGAHFVLAADTGTSSAMYFGAVVHKGKLFVQYVDPLEQADPREPKIGYRNAADLLTTVLTDTWYVLRLVVTDTQGLYVEAYRDGDEANASSYSLWMTTGYNWQFQEWTSYGTVDMDYYREFSMAGTAWGDNLGMDFGYDALNRLVSATPREDAEGYSVSYQYDEIGNLRFKNGFEYWYENPGPVHAVDALLAGGTPVNSYSYDANGNQTRREIVGASLSDRHYDAENRMTVVTETANSLTTVTRFFYDGDGVRIAQATEAGVTFYVGDLYEEFHEAGTSVVTATKYYYLGSQRVAMRTGSAVFYLHGDHLGSVSLTTDQSGAVVSKQHYYPFGEVFDPEGPSPTDFGFTGQRLDDSTGLMYYKARYYDAGLGRFVQADVIVPNPGNPQSFNRYTYVLNNPFTYVDPTGYIPEPELAEKLGYKNLQEFRESKIYEELSSDLDYWMMIIDINPGDILSWIHDGELRQTMLVESGELGFAWWDINTHDTFYLNTPASTGEWNRWKHGASFNDAYTPSAFRAGNDPRLGYTPTLNDNWTDYGRVELKSNIHWDTVIQDTGLIVVATITIFTGPVGWVTALGVAGLGLSVWKTDSDIKSGAWSDCPTPFLYPNYWFPDRTLPHGAYRFE